MNTSLVGWLAGWLAGGVYWMFVLGVASLGEGEGWNDKEGEGKVPAVLCGGNVEGHLLI